MGLIDGIDQQRVHSFHWQFCVGEDIGQRRFVCQIWAHFWFDSCFTELFCFYIETKDQPGPQLFIIDWLSKHSHKQRERNTRHVK